MDDIKTAMREAKYKELMIPPYKVDVSQDMKEFAAFQEIPNFGSHFYYAVSMDPLPEWQNFSKLKIPKELTPSSLEDDDVRDAREFAVAQTDRRAQVVQVLKRQQKKATAASKP